MIAMMSRPVQRGRIISRMGMSGFLVALLVLAACGASPSTTGGTAPTATTAPSPTVAASPTPAQAGYSIKVFFSKTPDSENSLNAVFSVTRMSPTAQVETYAVQLLIAGPTPEERAAGYYSELNALLNGLPLCPSLGPVGGPDFTLTLNTKGSTPQTGVATLKFCRATLSPGEGTDARVMAELKATLLQFASIKQIAVLNIQGHCFGDLSGQDRCLQ